MVVAAGVIIVIPPAGELAGKVLCLVVVELPLPAVPVAEASVSMLAVLRLPVVAGLLPLLVLALALVSSASPDVAVWVGLAVADVLSSFCRTTNASISGSQRGQEAETVDMLRKTAASCPSVLDGFMVECVLLRERRAWRAERNGKLQVHHQEERNQWGRKGEIRYLDLSVAVVCSNIPPLDVYVEAMEACRDGKMRSAPFLRLGLQLKD